MLVMRHPPRPPGPLAGPQGTITSNQAKSGQTFRAKPW